MSSIVRFYHHMVKEYLVVVQSFQAGALMTTGDLIAQTLVEKKEKIDLVRTAQFGSLGVILVGPAVASWYKFLSTTISAKDKFGPIKKVALDQFIFAPGFMPIFLTALNKLKGHDWEITKAEIHDKYFDIMLTNYQVWPLVQFINFKFVPLRYQVLMNQSVAIFWNSYVSWKTQRQVKK